MAGSDPLKPNAYFGRGECGKPGRGKPSGRTLVGTAK